MNSFGYIVNSVQSDVLENPLPSQQSRTSTQAPQSLSNASTEKYLDTRSLIERKQKLNLFVIA